MKEVCENCRPLFDVLVRRIEELERRLLAYENAHTPSSKRRFVRRPPLLGGRRGAPEGHEGSTRSDPEPTMRMEHVLDVCEHCKGSLGEPLFVERRLVEEVPEPRPVEVTEHLIPHYACPHCGQHTAARLPALGRFGPRTCAQVAVLKFSDRLPHAKVAQTLQRDFGLEVTPPTVMSITQRVAAATRDKYDLLVKRIRREPFVHIDETPFRVAGRQYWVWTFCTSSLTLYVVRPSRGRTVVQDVLKDYAGIIITDGYTVYDGVGRAQQRCWAHLLREAEFLTTKHGTAKPVFAALTELYHDTKALLKRRIHRVSVHASLTRRMRDLIDICDAHKELRKFGTTLRNGIHAWFTAILHKGMPLTNNLAERQLREIVVQRKIIGTLRTDQGCHTLETIMSLLATWQQTGKNTLQQLTTLLSRA